MALAGIERAGLRLGDPLVICGAGPIGMVYIPPERIFQGESNGGFHQMIGPRHLIVMSIGLPTSAI